MWIKQKLIECRLIYISRNTFLLYTWANHNKWNKIKQWIWKSFRKNVVSHQRKLKGIPLGTRRLLLMRDVGANTLKISKLLIDLLMKILKQQRKVIVFFQTFGRCNSRLSSPFTKWSFFLVKLSFIFTFVYSVNLPMLYHFGIHTSTT